MIVPVNGMQISRDTVLQPGAYLLPQGLTIAADDVTLDGRGAVLVGANQSGRGVTLSGRKNVTLKNLRMQGYYHGLYAHQCQNLTIQNCQFTGTAEVLPNTIFLDIWKTADDAYGGGIFLWEVNLSRVLHNDLQHQMNGLLTYQCRDLEVDGNVANYCSGFGFHLYETSHSVFTNNYADFCCRYHPRGEGGHMGADAAGFLIVYGSRRNTFRHNFARLGGDGFFLAGLTPQGEHRGCDENLFEHNDGSYSPNIAFEATFSRGNRYRANKANSCNYGFWLGFSREFELTDNQIWRNRQAGIAVENGIEMTVRGNDFQHNGHGLLLWSKHIDWFARTVPENDTSRNWLVEGNKFIHNDKAIRIAADQDHGIRPLPFGTPPTPKPHNHTIRRNEIRDNRMGIELKQVTETILEKNENRGNAEADILED
jgi:parallel beta-helix repeat protein